MATVEIIKPPPVEDTIVLTLTLTEAKALYWNIVPHNAEGDDVEILRGIEDALDQHTDVGSLPAPSWFYTMPERD